MEKYIFDCRQKLNDYPKYLKRNHKISQLPVLQQDQSTKCDYLKNKIFLTFDYSYYQNIPKTASMYVGKRINNLNALIAQDEVVPVDKVREGSVSGIQNTKWRKEKQNSHNNLSTSEEKRESFHRERKKIKMPVNSMPGVGDYYFEPNKIQKRIVYDVKIRGKPSDHRNTENILMQRPTNIPQSPLMDYGKQKINHAPSRSSKSANGVNTREVGLGKKTHADQEYTKFVNSIQITNVWRKLMEKHKLRGSKFDIYGYQS